MKWVDRKNSHLIKKHGGKMMIDKFDINYIKETIIL